MIADKLSKIQRLRLEALNQANLSTMHTGGSIQEILNRAEAFTRFIEKGTSSESKKEHRTKQ